MEKILNSPRLQGVVRAPSSKSEAHRALIVAALKALYGESASPVRIRCTDLSEDIEATARCLTALGATVIREGSDFLVTPITKIPAHPVLDCGESGSTLRFLLPVCCALGSLPAAPADFSASLVGHGRLPQRPLSPLYEELVAHGAVLSPMGSNPLVARGKLSAGRYCLAGNVSSQFISGLLFALPLLGRDSEIEIYSLVESVGYIRMTYEILTRVVPEIMTAFPVYYKIIGRNHRSMSAVSEQDLTVGGDWSSAAFFLTAGVLGQVGTSITLTGLSTASHHGDKAILDVLRNMGGDIREAENGEITAYPSRLHGMEIDASQIPDLVPVLAVAAAVAQGETRIVGASRLRIKESDRLATVTAMLTALGGDITETSDGLIIRGVPRLTGGVVDAAGDHRIAMSGAIASLVCDGAVTIAGAECVAKSYPTFWEEFTRLCKE